MVKSESKARNSSKEMLSSVKKEIIEESIAAGESTFTVVKRNGTIVPFRKERIFKAIESALRDTKKIDKEIPLMDDLNEVAKQVTHQVVEQLFELASKNVSLTVEGIQDLVEVTLMKNGQHDVARDYIIYRDHHKELRGDDPRNIKVVRRDSETPVRFNPIKIAASIEKIFRRLNKIEGQTPNDIISIVNTLSQQVVGEAVHLAKTDELHIHHIQNLVEEALMGAGYFQAAKDYILYRAEKGQQTGATAPSKKKKRRKAKDGERKFEFQAQDGEQKSITETQLLDRLDHACRGFEKIAKPEELLESAILNFYEGIKEEEVDQALIMSTKAKIEKDPIFSKIAARLLLDKLYRETLEIDTLNHDLEKRHIAYFKKYIAHGIKLDQVSSELAKFDLDALGKAMKLDRDDKFQYLGLQTLYDRYFIHENQRRLETPQIFWMRVAMGLAMNEKDKTKHTIEFYETLSKHDYLSATPTLFNSGTPHSQLSSCYLSTVMDDLEHIFKTISDDAQLSKWAGGLGNDWSNVRGTGARIKGTNGQSQGIIPFLKVANDTAVAVNQGGKRKGAMCAYLETWHIDIEDFIELRKNTGDERRRTHDMNTANWIPDLFMKRVKENGTWTLFSPNEVSDLHDLYGQAFEKRYLEYEKMADEGKILLWKRVESLQLWRNMLSMLFETGHPWITFKDPANIRSPQDHVGVVHSSNLCTEILLNTSKEETAVCNLGSINLAEHVTGKGLDEKKLAKTIRTAIRMLDNVIDVNFYPIPETKNANMAHRAIGLGLMGFQDALNILSLSYASHEAVEFADRSMEMISYYALLYSSELAKERNPYPSYKGSKWERGLLPIDTIDLLEKERGETVEMDRSSSMDWEKVRESIRKHGMRHSNVMAIAPTATIANIAGITPSIEPNYKNLYAKSNLSGEFTFSNFYLVNKLKELNLWDDEMIDDLKYFDGSVLEIGRVPKELKKQFLTSFEIDPEWIIECGSRRQKWIDQAQSLNLYLAEPSGKKLHNMYLFAWKKGVKTTYYCRTLGATQIEKSTLDINKRGLQPRWMKSESPSARIKLDRDAEPAVPVCNLEEGCESCQ
uniref:ribonucleoside-diphosphate reductase subunit alpha n=2 Tax=Candidatus Neptunichlamydia sp. REUL1 TaxID=3064277 RepID=UPI002930F4A7|nr:ribonucleoside-diphosphate reductase subunit alpha [Candidatus Neptunochlamydia sp. REUL1]